MIHHRFYVAADYARRAEMALTCSAIKNVTGWEPTARWVSSQPKYKDNGLGGELTGLDAEHAAVVAAEDFQDIAIADVFIQFTTGDKARGGRHVELGYALLYAENFPERKIIVVGPRENAFHYHPRVFHVEDAERLVPFLQGMLAAG